MKILVHDQQIRVSGFRFKKEIRVRTLLASYNEKPRDESFEDYSKRNIHNGGQFIWTNQANSVLSSNYAGKAEELQAKREAFLLAVEVVHGESVQIDGAIYKVVVCGEQYSDPVHFKQTQILLN